MKTKSLSRLALTVATTLAATAVVTALPEAAHAACLSPTCVTVNVGNTDYDVTTLTGTFTDNQTALTSTPWWDDSNLAGSFASAVGSSLGTPNFYDTFGPLFAYATGIDGYLPPGQDTVILSFLSDVNYPYPNNPGQESTYATATATATAVPTPALLPGLIGVCAAAWRKRKLASSTNA